MKNEKRTIEAGKPIQRILDLGDLVNVKSIIDEGSRTIWHPVTREVADRYGDVVRIDGMDAADFARKPAVLYGHSYGGVAPVTVIGTNVGFKIEGDILFAGTKFLDTQAAGMSQALKDLVNDNWLLHKAGLLGWSIGFIPTEVSEILEGGKFKGYEFKAWKLLEYSSVIIPAHQDAVNNSIRKGLLTEELIKRAGIEILEDLDLDPGPQPARQAAPLAVKSAIDEEVPAAEIELPAAAPEVVTEPVPADEPGPEVRPNATADPKVAEEPAGAPEPEIIEPVALAAEPTTKESIMENKTTPEPARHVELIDGPGAPLVRSISEIMARPAVQLNEVERELQKHIDDAVIVSSVLRKDPRSLKMYGNLGSSALRKALDTATSGEGSEFVPTALSAQFIEAATLESKVAALFNDIPMPTNPYKIPYFAGIGADSFYQKPEATSDSPAASPASTPATGDQTLTAKSLIAIVPLSDELSEDSIVPIVPMLKAALVKGAAAAEDDVIINGDTTATHMDSDVTDARDRRKIWNGLRDLCQSGNKADHGTFSTANVLALLKTMGKYAINPDDLAFIVGPTGYHLFRALSEVQTVDKYGANATLLKGEIGKLVGSPIIASEAIRQNLNASGVYDATTMTKTIWIAVNRKGFMRGYRGLPKLEFERDAKVGQNYLILTLRRAFQPVWTPSSTVTTIALGYNVA